MMLYFQLASKSMSLLWRENCRYFSPQSSIDCFLVGEEKGEIWLTNVCNLLQFTTKWKNLPASKVPSALKLRKPVRVVCDEILL